ncbi:MAG TPA: hypothetical protein VN841_28680 [Bryobacteraceae bacterium]|nr:hypothetical protein [Bryobacteraceae bacterium]
MSVFSVSLLPGSLFDGRGALSPVLPWAPYLFLGLAVAGVLAMYVTLKREIAAQAGRNRRVEAMLLRLKEAGSAAAGGAAVQHAGAPAGAGLAPSYGGGGDDVGFHPPLLAFAPAGPRPGMNLSRRVQALRLFRRGEELGYIAAALSVPRCEVELLVRVHRLAVASTASPENAPPPTPVPERPASALTGAQG